MGVYGESKRTTIQLDSLFDILIALVFRLGEIGLFPQGAVQMAEAFQPHLNGGLHHQQKGGCMMYRPLTAL